MNKSPSATTIRKTDSIAEYNSPFKISSSTLSLRDSDFDVDFDNVSVNSDVSSLNNWKPGDSFDFPQEDHKKKSQQNCSTNSVLVIEGKFGHQQPEATEATINSTLETRTATKTQKNGHTQENSFTKFFTLRRILWWIAAFIVYWSCNSFFALFVFMLQFAGSQSTHKRSKRTIKWIVEDFFEQMKAGILTSSPFMDASGQWCLVVVQKKCIDGLQTSFGLIAMEFGRDVEFVKATVEFSCVNHLGQDLSIGLKSLYFQHSFACVGDSGYSRAILLSPRQLGENKEVYTKCRIEFERQEIGFCKVMLQRFVGVSLEHPSSKRIQRTNANYTNIGTQTFGQITLQRHFQQGSSNDKIWRSSQMAKFIQHPETKTFVWEIPNFTELLKNVECWGIWSPEMFVNSHDFCSIWRMKLFELVGVFRLHIQLRGLPGAVKQVKTWHLITLLDNYGDYIVPEDCNPRLRYPDYLNLWGVNRHILYRRENILDRFVSATGSVTIRISLQVEPNELQWMEGTGSDGWILS